jgi:hypothetical protein
MKSYKVTLLVPTDDNVTKEFVLEYFEKMMKEKVHNPVEVEVEEIKINYEMGI